MFLFSTFEKFLLQILIITPVIINFSDRTNKKGSLPIPTPAQYET